jgi:hypothetical protein
LSEIAISEVSGGIPWLYFSSRGRVPLGIFLGERLGERFSEARFFRQYSGWVKVIEEVFGCFRIVKLHRHERFEEAGLGLP